MTLLEISQLTFAYDAERVVSDVSLSIERGAVVSLLGPSGCGKSTLLRLIAGLETPVRGQINIIRPLQDNPENTLRLLFQDYDAYPWFTVEQNVRFGSGPKPFPPAAAVTQMLHRVGLTASEKRYPAELSGGMKKRLGLARCLIRTPTLMLFDEPFSSLDVEAQREMYDLVQKLWAENHSTVFLITHNLHEAILLSDRVLVSSPKPLSIVEDVAIPLKRPRDDSIADLSEYHGIRRRIANALHYSTRTSSQTSDGKS